MTPARTAPLGTPPQGPQATPAAAAAAPGPRRITVAQVVGEVLLTIGALLLLFAFYESFWTNIASGKMQEEAQQKLEVQWDNQWVNPREQPAPALGDAFAKMYIPTFGSDYQFAIIEGVDEQDLLAGPGRYPDTQMPGEAGNFAVAGHRVGKGAPFNDLGALNTCDAIVVETRSSWVTYRVLPMSLDSQERLNSVGPCLPERMRQAIVLGDYAGIVGRHITTPSDINVVNPMPGQPSMEVAEGMERLITLTTCHPQFSNAERMIIHAVATEVLPKSPGGGEMPKAMTEVN